MKVFISHSGGKSRAAAAALRDWLPNVIQSLEPWMSQEDIAPGTRWATELQVQLRNSKYGILCITRANAFEPWLLFEAGSLAKTVDKTYVVPLLIDLSPSDLPAPLSQFQGVPATKEGLRSVVEGINTVVEPQLPESRLMTSFEHWWPQIEASLSSLPEDEVGSGLFPGKIYVSVPESILQESPGGIEWDNRDCYLVRERDSLRESVALVAVPTGGGAFEVEMGASLRAAVQPDRSYELFLTDVGGRAWRVPPFYLYQKLVEARPMPMPAAQPTDGGD